MTSLETEKKKTEKTHALKKFQNHIYGQPVLTFAVRAVAVSKKFLNNITLTSFEGNPTYA